MHGPYEWEPPSYWFSDSTDVGGAFGFASEICPGPSIPPKASLDSMMSASDQWPVGGTTWNFHCGSGTTFNKSTIFTNAQNSRYGTSTDIASFSLKAQIASLESHRAMYDAYESVKYRKTGGLVQWMLGNAWPSLIWHLYDWYLRPGGSYYGVKNAGADIHAAWDPAHNRCILINNTTVPQTGLSVHARFVDLTGKTLGENTAITNIAADTSTIISTVAFPKTLPTTCLLRLAITNNSSDTIAISTYWISSKQDVLDWQQTDWYITPTSSYGDFTALASLDSVVVSIAAQKTISGNNDAIRVTATNTGTIPAFGLHISVCNATGTEILPVRWSDNYTVLLPGESRIFTALYTKGQLPGSISISAEGFNIRTYQGVPVGIHQSDKPLNISSPRIITVFDLRGRRLGQLTDRDFSGTSQSVQASLHLSSGMYIIKCTLKDAVSSSTSITPLLISP